MENFQNLFLLFGSPVHRHDARKYLIADCFLNKCKDIFLLFILCATMIFFFTNHKAHSTLDNVFHCESFFAFSLQLIFRYRTISIEFCRFLLVRSLPHLQQSAVLMQMTIIYFCSIDIWMYYASKRNWERASDKKIIGALAIRMRQAYGLLNLEVCLNWELWENFGMENF